MDTNLELCIRNFPESFNESDVRDFLSQFGIISAKFLRRRKKISAIINVPDETLAKCIVSRLHQLKILENRLSVEYHNSQEVETVDVECVIPSDKSRLNQSAQELSKFAKALHAVHPVEFSQPPPPYLKYRYPRPTREIIDSICVALESVPKFYTQVLHLMNRMNLPPPFTPRDLQRNGSVTEKKHASQQTDIVWIKESLLAEGESELESDEEVLPVKRKFGLDKNRFKPYILPQIVNAPKNESKPSKGPLQPRTKPSQNIILHIPEELKTTRQTPPPLQRPSTPPPTNVPPTTEIDLLANRIPADQLSELPVFKNYIPATPSNKLYLKNLAKTVTEDDLKRIFHRFAITTDPNREIDIKLMQSGRMKGQAFVTFSYIYEEDLDRLPEKPIARALRLTNGLILRDKPMVVVYGKSAPSNKPDGGEKASS
ncbi:RNA-binding region-containing protein 3 [Ochlerotatus camptorhynchus]|uniref:RNA-binding region-containing protein 3 n=1 Tax=Ochlerotatus camptorhynchus TaxID=644619 RepID=UPI0031D31C01